MNALIRAAADLQAVCANQGWRYCFIGGLAEPVAGHGLAQLAELKEAPELVDKLEHLKRSITR